MMDPMQSAASPAGRGARNRQQPSDRHNQCTSEPEDTERTPSLFDAIEDSRRRRDAGQTLVRQATDPRWRVAFEDAIARWAATGRPFTIDDLADDVGRTLASPVNAAGALMSAAARRGLIVKTGTYVASRQASRQGAVVAEWVGRGGR